MRVPLYAKMLKETENEETRFFDKFLSLVAFQLRGLGPTGPTPLATPMILRSDRALKFFHKKHLRQNSKQKLFSKTWRTRVKSLDSFLKPPGIA